MIVYICAWQTKIPRAFLVLDNRILLHLHSFTIHVHRLYTGNTCTCTLIRIGFISGFIYTTNVQLVYSLAPPHSSDFNYHLPPLIIPHTVNHSLVDYTMYISCNKGCMCTLVYGCSVSSNWNYYDVIIEFKYTCTHTLYGMCGGGIVYGHACNE